MALTKKGIEMLQVFEGSSLNKTHVKIIIKPPLTDRKCKVYSRYYKAIFNNIATQVANIAAKKLKV